MSGKETVSARVPQDTNKRFEQYREQRDISKSEAGKRLIERGLDWETGETAPGGAGDPSKLGERAAWGVLSGAVAGLAFGAGQVAGWFAIAAAVLFIGTGAYRWRAGQ